MGIKDASARRTLGSSRDATPTTSSSTSPSIGGVSAFSTESTSSLSLPNASFIPAEDAPPVPPLPGDSPTRSRFRLDPRATPQISARAGSLPAIRATGITLARTSSQPDASPVAAPSRIGSRSAGQATKIVPRAKGRSSLPGETTRPGRNSASKTVVGPPPRRISTTSTFIPSFVGDIALPVNVAFTDPFTKPSAPVEPPSPYARRPCTRRTLGTDGDRALGSPEQASERTWYDSIAGSKHHPLSKEKAPYWMSYERDTQMLSALLLDASRTYWGTLAAPFSEKRFDDDGGRPDLPPPRRVLDLGCGPKAPWCIGLSREVGFEDAEFVGLDVCPDEVTDVLREAKRLLFVKHDFLADKLPFEDNTFDYVHASFISPAVPGADWDRLISEMVRVARPLAPVELNEADVLSAHLGDDSSSMVEAFSASLASRNLARDPLAVLPSLLAKHCQDLWLTIRPAALPRSPEGDDPASSHDDADATARVLSQAVAQAVFASRESVWEDRASELVKPRESIATLDPADSMVPETLRRGSTATAASKRDAEAVARGKFDADWDDWRTGVEKRADLATALESCWGWKCEADERAREGWLETVDILEGQLEWVEEECRVATRGSKSGTKAAVARADSELSNLTALKEQTKRSLAQTQVDLLAVQMRLGTAATDSPTESGGGAGPFRLATFIGYKPDA